MRHILYSIHILLVTDVHSQPSLWGITSMAGEFNKGNIFSINTDGSGRWTRFDFDGLSGWALDGGLCLASNAYLYGVCKLGGELDPAKGTLIKIDPITGAFYKLMDFDGSNGGSCHAPLLSASDGLLYGSAFDGEGTGGSIFSVDPATDIYTELYALDQYNDGAQIRGRLCELPDGSLFGTSSQEGISDNYGTIFKYIPSVDSLVKVHDFDGDVYGGTPYGGLTLAADGWLYGTTYKGGNEDKGIIYRFHPDQLLFEKIIDLHDVGLFDCSSSLLSINNDLLIGSAGGGGSNGAGALFSVIPSTGVVIEISAFTFATGAEPIGSPMLGDDGYVYGTTYSGGPSFGGSIYRFDPQTSTREDVYQFTPIMIGAKPTAPLTLVHGNVSIEESANTGTIQIFPNPTSGMLTLMCDPKVVPVSVNIADATGRSLQKLSLLQHNTTIDLNLPVGFYFVSIYSKAGSTSKRVVVQ